MPWEWNDSFGRAGFTLFSLFNWENFGFATAKRGILDSATANLEIEKMSLRI